jgi:hypothetical protein
MASSSAIPLPTAWLAPPDGLIPSKHPATIELVPLAIGATLAFIVLVLTIILAVCDKRGVFVEDTIADSYIISGPAAISRTDDTASRPAMRTTRTVPASVDPTSTVSTSHVNPAPTQSNSSPDTNNERRRHLPPPARHRQPDLDGSTLTNFNSAYYPPARSEASVGTKTAARSRFGSADHSRAYDMESDTHTYSEFLEDKFPGDPY